MKILHVADLHLDHDWFDWLAASAINFDLLVIAGDLQDAFSRTPRHTQAQSLRTWLTGLPTRTVVCSGNHDCWPQSSAVSVDPFADGAWLHQLQDCGPIVAVDGTLREIDCLRLAVNGWNQHFQVREPVDVWVTHAPPAGCPCAQNRSGTDQGDPTLRPALHANPPSLVLCGHVHDPRALACTWPHVDSSTWVLVPGFASESPIPAHWIIDTTTGRAEHSGGLNVAWRVP